ncbi:MAG: glycoside hydrolase family 140 protein [Lunatimonas sp.]|uniref:glycoside hydrolase family 140 protein n=1 Tax=Lunatimonas sp. TaxID=2060141 RepID=UPI00263A96F7|nr:glycoside hydrolase family 140 protein [Lunatimonas sp.]MCC5937556.1 glycoside hydrolase family 140 protein [Lunatimonas sp.]
MKSIEQLRSVFLLTFFAVVSTHTLYGQLPRLKVSDNQRFLVTEQGDPFFWLADTAWELFHRCDREEVLYYLDKRASQGFNVVQAVALAEIDGLRDPNTYGHIPLENLDPTKPVEAYFEHVDFAIQEAAKRGIYIALLPTWGDKVFKSSWGEGPEVFTIENAYIFGKWIGTRYREYTNIIWVIGGDRNPRQNTRDVEIWNQLALGVVEGVGGNDRALMTFHPQPAKPGGSSNWFHEAEWLDFNMHQTGHCPNQATYRIISHDYGLTPAKPTIDGEPLYEDHPNCFNAKELGYSIPEDIRRIMYWNVFAGAFGQTYGCHAVWQMYTPERKPINAPLRPWKVALDLPIAHQVQHLKSLLLSRPFLSRVPAQELVTSDQGDDKTFVAATKDVNGSYAMFYFPSGKPVRVDLSSLASGALTLTWFDPRTGNTYSEGTISRDANPRLVPPTAGAIGHDWVAIVDAK